jgi:plastocyanin
LTAPKGASTSGFAEQNLSVAADTPFTIEFRNNDPDVPHNVEIFGSTSSTDAPLWAPPGNAVITGVDQTTFAVSALGAATYTYRCSVHPTTMYGTLTVDDSG